MCEELTRDEADLLLRFAVERRNACHADAFEGYTPANFDGLVSQMRRWDAISRKLANRYGLRYPALPVLASDLDADMVRS